MYDLINYRKARKKAKKEEIAQARQKAIETASGTLYIYF
jgi:hypothetical protein